MLGDAKRDETRCNRRKTRGGKTRRKTVMRTTEVPGTCLLTVLRAGFYGSNLSTYSPGYLSVTTKKIVKQKEKE